MNRTPIIGIAGYLLPPVNSVFPYRQETINEAYTSAIQKAGGFPFLLSCTNDEKLLEAAVDAVDGILIPGGLDVDPSMYGEETLACCKEHYREIDLFQSVLIDVAIKKNRPILGICRGCQIINVHHGGSLYQDLETCFSKEICHPSLDKPEEAVHEVTIKEKSLLYGIFNKERLYVNSLHHQGIKTLGKGLNAVATAPDGLIEGIEDENNGIIAVQWHPEAMMKTDCSFLGLFKELIHMTRM